MTTIDAIVQNQRTFYNTGVTRDVEYRVKQLRLLEQVMKENEQILLDAIYADLKKSEYDTFSSELSLVYREISFMAKNIRKWSAKAAWPWPATA